MRTERAFRLARVAALGLLLSVGVAACSGGTSPSSAGAHKSTTTTTAAPTTTTTSLASVQALINKLYYDESQAFQNNGVAAGEQAVYDSDYPGTVNQSSFQSCVDTGRNVVQTEVPALSTMQLDPTWVPVKPIPSQPYWIAQPGPPPGTTYILQVTATYPTGPVTALVHVTILNGKAYFYEGPIC